jgi:hypothetical protein
VVLNVVPGMELPSPPSRASNVSEAWMRTVATLPAKDQVERFGEDWHNWLRCQILLREAEKLVEKDGK